MSATATIAIIGAIFAGLSALDINLGDNIRIRGAISTLNEKRVKELESRVQKLTSMKDAGTLKESEVETLKNELESIVESYTPGKTSHFSKED